MIKLRNILALLPLTLLPCIAAQAQNLDWDEILMSDDYYYGVGHGRTEAEADKAALADLTSQIATYVSADFHLLYEESGTNDQTEQRKKVTSCIRTYPFSHLNNVKKWPSVGLEPDVTVRRYMKREELERIFSERVDMIRDMVATAEEALQQRKVDFSLQYYYWAYTLLRSLQHPAQVRDNAGHILLNWLPLRIDEVLGKVAVAFEKQEDDYVDLLVSYDGQPVSSLHFSYSDGRMDCRGDAKDGRAHLEMAPGYHTDTYHLTLEYEYKALAQGDNEMKSVLEVIPRKAFRSAELTVQARKTGGTANKPGPAATVAEPGPAISPTQTGVHLQPGSGQTVEPTAAQLQAIEKVTEAVRTRRYASADRLFTIDGLLRWRELVKYGRGRIVGTPDIVFFRGMNQQVVARGLQMAFSFMRGGKKTFVEDVVLTFDKNGKIANLTFGLGQVAENDILCKHPGWNDETKELIMEFMENYKTAYCLKDSDYIRNIFADDAIIIVGNLARHAAKPSANERPISVEGQQVIRYNRYTKEEYLRNLNRCFRRNEFINLRFSNNDVQWIEKYNDEELFAIQIGQEYSSSTYSDRGYLFLLVNMTDHEQPQIRVRTWQPNEVDLEKLYNAGDFYSM
ncbi:MAG: hypothetical protein K5928_01250 [Prevotella sp.]|nr:hypothetical protein [Prevotella sp.]